VSLTTFQSPPELCERLETITRRFGGSIRHIGESRRVEYALPTRVAAPLREFLAQQAIVTVAPTCIAELPGGRVLGSGNVLSPDGRSLVRDVSEDFGKPFDQHWLLTYPRMPAPLPLKGRTAVVATTLGSGYSHWLLEELPRLLLGSFEDCDALIAHTKHPFARAALAMHGFTGALIDARRGRHWACDELVVPSMLSTPGFPTQEAVRLVETFAAPLMTGESRWGERLYLSRAKAKRRRVVREEALVSALESRGFRCLYLEEMTWAEQVCAFSHAREIVAPHGAGLANTVFCRAGTKVVELFHREYVNPCFWRLASIQRLDYRPIADDTDEPCGMTLCQNRHDIEIAPDQVLDALNA
jgi:capsular polysaccharide biosynthesis protein